MICLENRGETIIFMLRHFDETMFILTIHFLRFGTLKISTGDYYVLRINKITYFNRKWDVLFISVFSSIFSTFPTHSFVQGGVQMAYG